MEKVLKKRQGQRNFRCLVLKIAIKTISTAIDCNGLQRKAPAQSPGKTADLSPRKGAQASSSPGKTATLSRHDMREILAEIGTKAGMHILTKWAKPYFYNKGAAPTLANGSSSGKMERLQSVVDIIKAHNLFGMRASIAEVMTDVEVKKQFAKRLFSVFHSAAKVSLPVLRLQHFH